MDNQKNRDPQLRISLVIVDLVGPVEITERLREFGLRPGVPLFYFGRTGFGGAHLLQAGNAWLALRESEFQCLKM